MPAPTNPRRPMPAAAASGLKAPAPLPTTFEGVARLLGKPAACAWRNQQREAVRDERTTDKAA